MPATHQAFSDQPEPASPPSVISFPAPLSTAVTVRRTGALVSPPTYTSTGIARRKLFGVIDVRAQLNDDGVVTVTESEVMRGCAPVGTSC